MFTIFINISQQKNVALCQYSETIFLYHEIIIPCHVVLITRNYVGVKMQANLDRARGLCRGGVGKKGAAEKSRVIVGERPFFVWSRSKIPRPS